MDIPNLKHSTTIQIRFVDLDAFGHVNNAVYASYYEMARVSFFDDYLGKHINWNKNGLILAKNTLDYFLPVFLKDEIFCLTGILKLGNKSLEIQNSLIRKSEEKIELVAQARGVLVCFDYNENISIPIPDVWRVLLEKTIIS